MNAILPPQAAARLVKVLGMLGSAHDGEALAAGRAADQLIRSSGVTWESALEPLTRVPRAEPQPDCGNGWHAAREAPAWRDLVADILDSYPHWLNRWETDFLGGLLRRHSRHLTPKQKLKLREIARKCRT